MNLNLTAEGAEWRQSAACAQVDPDLWFPEKGGSTREPIAICNTCPVKAECLAYAMEHPGLSGVWGGKSAKQRTHMRLRGRRSGYRELRGLLDSGLSYAAVGRQLGMSRQAVREAAMKGAA